ncbi:sugar kinase [Streptomyces hoynatensis]|uniref:Sugar kinase n=2 Tax=Streptomyces hoynatensis TaxID=1141874 RepID=A0A3A9YZC0_9ACTN|nr:sugar kinase [Streptomyces hoynatensis]RKN40526.1 sugar kinase [Streptomyces hoynatensis]
MLSVQAEGPLAVGGGARLTLAGAEANVAVGLARLGHRARWAGRLGADEPGRVALRALRGEGVDVAHATLDPGAPTGAMLREARVADLARVHYWRAGSAASRQRPEDLAPALAAGARMLHLTGITAALGEGPLACVREAARHGHAHGWTVVLDVNHRTRLWPAEAAAAALRPLLPHVDVLIASEDELPLVAGPEAAAEEEQVASLLGSGVREVLITRGGRGADRYAREAPGGVHAAAPAVPVRDVVGAGDAFCAGYLSGLLDGLGPAERLARATTCGAFAVATSGDWEGLPHRDELPLLHTPPGTTLR